MTKRFDVNVLNIDTDTEYLWKSIPGLRKISG